MKINADGVRHAVIESNRSQGGRSGSANAFLDILIGFWKVDLAEAQRRLSAWQEATTDLVGIEHFKTGHIRVREIDEQTVEPGTLGGLWLESANGDSPHLIGPIGPR